MESDNGYGVHILACFVKFTSVLIQGESVSA